MKYITRGALLLLLAVGCRLGFAQTPSHDLSYGFPLTGNSNGVWSYDQQDTLLETTNSLELVVPNVSRTIDDGGGSGLLNTQLRYQIIYDASLFPGEIMRITELRMRPSSRFGGAFTSTIPNLQINLSTTSVEPNQLNGTFAQNVGADEVVVFQGPLTVSSRFVGPANGPKEFDIIIPLSTPFFYDSSRGNLLIDFRNASGSGASYVDIGQRTDDGASRLYATSVDATSFTGADSGAEVFQIVYVPQTEVPPSIYVQPHSRSTFSGENVTLTVGAFGSSPLKYQWRKGDTVIVGATNSTLIFTNLQVADAGSYTVVVSNAYGVVTSEVATLIVSESSALVVPNVSRTIDDGGGSTLLSAPSRHQVVYDASLFPVEIMRITELRMRPSAASGSAFAATISNLQINLSTTSVEPNQMNGVFAQNVGVDDTLVFQGALTASSGFIGPAVGPKQFDIIIPLSTPFLYDPSRGNLLMDFRNASGSSAGFVDMGQRTDDGASRLFATSVDATSFEGADFGAEVFQLLYTRQTEVPPLIYVQPHGRSTFVGETVTFTVEASGSRPLNYQWHRDGAATPEATNATLVLSNMQLSQAGNYFVVVSNASGVVTSQTATLTVSESPVLVVPNVSRTIDDGGGSTLLQAPARHQVVYDASLFPVEIMRITELRMRPSAALGRAFTATISNLQINLSTTSVEPNGLNGTFAQNVGADEAVAFQGALTVSSGFIGPAGGPKEFDIIIPLTTPFLYDPSRGNLLIDFRNVSGSAASVVDLGGRSDDGASRVFATPADATSVSGADYGAEVFQIVYTRQTDVPPLIYVQPDSRSTFVGETVTFTIGASGSRPLNYQWYRGAAAIPEATNATLVLTNMQLSQAGNYSVVVSNTSGVVSSQTATLTVSESFVLVVPNVSRTMDGGGGSTLLQGAWRQQIVYGASQFPSEIMRITELRMRPSAAFGNAFTSTIPNLQINLSTTSIEPHHLTGTFAQNVGADEVVVFEGALTVSSRFVGPVNGPKEFDIIIPLTTPFLYDPSRGNLLIDFRNASGSSQSFVDMGSRTDDGASRVFATPADVTSATAADSGAEVLQIVYTLQTEVPPSIFAQPSSRSTFVGETVTLTVGVSGSSPLNFRWRKGSTEIVGATSSSLILTNVQLADAGSYSVVVSNAYGVATSQGATLTVSESSPLVVPNVSRTVDDGGGSGLLNTQLRYQIVYNDSLFPVEIMRITELRMRPSSQFGSAFTSTIPNLQINLSTTSVEPNALDPVFAQNVGADDVAVFQGSLTVSSGFLGPAAGPKEFDIIIPLMTPFLYDPSRGNLLIDFRNASGSSASFVDMGRRADDGASRVFATSADATSSAGADSGAEVFQIIYTRESGIAPSIFAQPASRNTLLGDTVELSVGASGSPPLNYQWRRDGTAIPDATNATLVLTNVQLSQSGNYSAAVSNAYGIVTSQSAALTVSERSVLVVPNVNWMIDGGSGSGLLNTKLRYQIVYDASLFPVDIMRITELRLRPSSQFGGAFTATISNLQINLSTTSIEPDYLNRAFAQNVGTNDTVVFEGPLAVSSRFVGPANGPKEFDIIIPLTTPFLYDPSRGNLLIDFRNASGSSASFVDTGQRPDDGASRVFATSVGALFSTQADSGAEVFQIVYSQPEGGSAPSIIGQPQTRSVFAGETVSLSVQAVGTAPLKYEWLKGGTPIMGVTNAVITFANVQPSDAGSYSVMVSNAYGVATSQSATLTVSESSAVAVPNVSRTIEGGGASTLLQALSRHQTVYDDSLFPDELMRITELRLRPSSRFGSAFTATISNLQINLSTTSVEPNQLNGTFSQNVGADEVVVFQGPLTVSSGFVGPANGPKEFDIIIPLTTPFLYDPRGGNLLIDFRNASGSSAGLVDLGSRADDGASRVFAASMDATSATGADSGAEAFQILYTRQSGVPPSILVQPRSHTTFAGETVALTVATSGSRPLSYQWRRDAAAILDATNATLIVTNVQVADAGSYSVVVSNAYGVITSESATLTLSESSALVVPNVSRTIDDGGGSGLLRTRVRYQIVYDASLFPVELMRITELRMRPSARFGNAFTSTISNLQINLSTTSVEPNQLNGVFAQNVGADEVMVFQGPLTVSSRFVGPASGPKEFDIIIPLTTPFLYDPNRGNLLIDFRNVSGSSASFVDMGQRTDDGASRAFATSVGATSATGADYGAEVFQIVYTQNGVAPLIYAQPPSSTVFSGQTVSLTVGVSGSPPLNYQWLKGGTTIPGGTNAVLTIANVRLADAGSYSVVVSNANGVVTSERASLTVSESSAVVVPNVSAMIDDGGGSGLLNTQLHHQIVYDASLFPVELMRITELRMRPSAAFGRAFTSTIPSLKINLSTTRVEPDHLNGTFAQNVGPDEVVVFEGPLTVSSRFVGPAAGPKEFDIIIPLSTPFLYEPNRGNLLLDFRNAAGSGASFVDMGRRTDDGASRMFAPSVNATSFTAADYGAEVFQIVYTPQSGVPPSIFDQPHSRTASLGETVTLVVGVSGSRPLSYQWHRDGTAILDATNATLVLTNVQLSQANHYSVVVSNAFGTATSQTASLAVSQSSPVAVPNLSGPIDSGPGSGLLNTRLRHQIVYDASLFPVETMRIMELRLRPSAQFGNAFTATISNLQINLSTTSVGPDQLHETFALNVGADEIVVFQGSLTVSSGFVGPANGPKEFDIIIPMTTPFLYDPSRGNLLIDFRNASGSSASLVDIGQRTGDGASRLSDPSVNATSSARADSAAEIFQIVYMPENVPPLIFAQPPSRTTFLERTVPLAVGASGSPRLNYQWRREGTAILDATNATLVLTNVQLSHAGNYSVLVSNAFGTATSQAATLTVIPTAPEADYDLSRDFSLAGNPNGVWSYGRQDTIGGAFTLLRTAKINVANVQVQVWAINEFSQPAILHNDTTQTAITDGGEGIFPPETTWFGPGVQELPGNYAVVRLTVPAGGDGTYQLTTVARPAYTTSLQRDTDFHVTRNNMEIFGVQLSGAQIGGYTDALSLVAGDRIDFAVGRGADKSHIWSQLKVEATLTKRFSHLQVSVTNVSGGVRTLALTLNGLFGSCTIEASSNLIHWVTITNIVGAGGQVLVNDPAINTLPQRFYRTRIVE